MDITTASFVDSGRNSQLCKPSSKLGFGGGVYIIVVDIALVVMADSAGQVGPGRLERDVIMTVPVLADGQELGDTELPAVVAVTVDVVAVG